MTVSPMANAWSGYYTTGCPGPRDQQIVGGGASPSRWRDYHCADALSPSLLIHLLKVEGVQHNDSLVNG